MGSEQDSAVVGTSAGRLEVVHGHEGRVSASLVAFLAGAAALIVIPGVGVLSIP